MCIFILIVLHFLDIPNISGFPRGPPDSICAKGLPKHRSADGFIGPQTTDPPYRLTVNVTTITYGQTIKVKLQGLNERAFRGLFLQMRELEENSRAGVAVRALGKFNPKSQNFDTLDCQEPLDTVGHANGYDKWEMEAEWTAPYIIKGDIVVRATILEDFETYWSDVRSPVIKVHANGPSPVEVLQNHWFSQVVSTVSKLDDKKALEREIVRRFEMGFDGMISPTGHIITPYVVDVLPYEDRFPKHPTVKNNGRHSFDNNGPRNVVPMTTTTTTTTTTTSAITTVVQESVSRNKTETKSDDSAHVVSMIAGDNLSMIEKANLADNYYRVMVKAVLNGDILVAKEMEKIMKNRNKDVN